MRLVFATLILLAACGQAEPPPPLPEATQAVDPPWFICDAIEAPVLLSFEREGATARVAQFEKPSGAIVQRTQYRIGAQEGAAGSVYTTLMQNNAEAGAIRQINPGVLETPGAAYTEPFTSVRIGEREISCRWLPRTRVFGFTGRRSFVVHEDRDGDLIYTTYDFADAASAQPIELSENGRTTTFSVEVRGGEEHMSPDGAAYRFTGEDDFTYVVTLARDGAGRLDVTRGGETVQSEPLIAFVHGSAG